MFINKHVNVSSLQEQVAEVHYFVALLVHSLDW